MKKKLRGVLDLSIETWKGNGGMLKNSEGKAYQLRMLF